jgi:hypothetical protein
MVLQILDSSLVRRVQDENQGDYVGCEESILCIVILNPLPREFTVQVENSPIIRIPTPMHVDPNSTQCI